ncbi:MAG: hypothetical protein ACU0GG_09165 [Paracoccaceae bacterium]
MIVSRLLASLVASVALALPAIGQSGGLPVSSGATALEHQALVDATATFFDTVEAQRPMKRKLPTIGVPRVVTPSSSIKTATRHEEALTKRGAVDHLTGYRVTWYPLDRLYGTVDFMGTWGRNRNLVCGYLTWDLSDPERPVLEAVSARFVETKTLLRDTRRGRHQTLLEANCAAGTLTENFHLFDIAG